jgi:predicted nucleic acid-binding protein
VKVFSNTTPFIALASIDRLDLLPKLFGQIHVVDEVTDECAAGGTIVVTPLRGLDWIVPVQSPPQPAPHILLELDKGEKATLLAALANHADLVLMDEKIGRNMAEYLGLKVSGTLGVLLKARKVGLIPSFRDAAQRMRDQGIFYNPALIDRMAATVGE